jgi:hypothetical protein
MILSACGYDARFTVCVVQCTQSTGCPQGLICGSENLCRPPGETCGNDAEVPDSVPSCMNFSDPIVDLALDQPAQADQIRSANENASKANDGNDTSTRWSSADGTPGHWWLVDLGSDRLLDSINTLWERGDVAYRYDVSISSDGETFTTAINKTTDTLTARARIDTVPNGTCTRYVRITKTDTTGWWAILYTVNVMGR